MIQVSMDVSSVNLDMLNGNLERELDYPILLDFGNCGLHRVHGTFQTDAKASGFEISSLLPSLNYLFNDSLARRDDYTKPTSSSVLPLKFCTH